jgi:hypothetical protein
MVTRSAALIGFLAHLAVSLPTQAAPKQGDTPRGPQLTKRPVLSRPHQSPLSVPPVQPADCDQHPDRDGDGDKDDRCGGHDCDDADPSRSSLGAERCDGLYGGKPAAEHDEDCDPHTVFGVMPDGDHDGDGLPSYECSNPIRPDDHGRTWWRFVHIVAGHVYGADCDDRNVAIVPGAMYCAGPTAVAVCLGPGKVESVLALSGLGPASSLGPRPGTAVLSCPAGTHCVNQPNGTGVCAP